jgi:HSP20 family protein
MSKEKRKSLAVKKEKKTVPAVRKPQPESIQDLDQLLDTLRSEIVWDPFRGFEWPVEYELPTRIPYVDVIDSGKEYIVKAELPGLKKEDVELEVGSNELLLTAKSSVESEEKGINYLHRERAYSTFRRYIGFAEGVDTVKVSASITDGVLEVILPKLEPEPEKKKRKIKPQ